MVHSSIDLPFGHARLPSSQQRLHLLHLDHLLLPPPGLPPHYSSSSHHRQRHTEPLPVASPTPLSPPTTFSSARPPLPATWQVGAAALGFAHGSTSCTSRPQSLASTCCLRRIAAIASPRLHMPTAFQHRHPVKGPSRPSQAV